MSANECKWTTENRLHIYTNKAGEIRKTAGRLAKEWATVIGSRPSKSRMIEVAIRLGMSEIHEFIEKKRAAKSEAEDSME